MAWSTTDLASLAYSAACQKLSEAACSCVPTHTHGDLRAGGPLGEALQLHSRAEDALRLAVVYERVMGSSWQKIGDALGTSRQAAHQRYAGVVDDITERMLFPWRDGADGTPGSWACPDGLEDPERTVSSLDAWEARHREPPDPARGDTAVSDGLSTRADTGISEAISLSSQLEDRLTHDNLPADVSEPTARRMLLEAKIRAYDLLASTDSSARRREARTVSDHHKRLRRRTDEADLQVTDVQQGHPVRAKAFEQLVRWHRERLGHMIHSDDAAFIIFDGRALRLLSRSDDPSSEQARGWYLWGLGDQGHTEPLTGPRLPPGLLQAALLATGDDADGQLVAPADEPIASALAAALDAVCERIAGDTSRGVSPFAPGGIAGPPGP